MVGVDYSGRLIDAALQLQSNQEVVWAASDGETTQWSMKLPECVSRNSMDSVVFKQVRSTPQYTTHTHVCIPLVDMDTKRDQRMRSGAF